MTDLDVARGGRVPRRSGRPAQKIVRKSKRFRGVPPPPKFDIDELPDNVKLSIADIAAIFRRSISAVNHWQTHQMKPFDWHLITGRWVCTVGSARAVLKAEEKK
jgi:hypothetical protein